MRKLSELDERTFQAWRELEEQSDCRNPFQSASYVLAAARHLPHLRPPLILTIGHPEKLLALGVFEAVSGSRRFPLKHLRAWQTPHTYFDAPLIRREKAERALELFWNHFVTGRHEWHGVEFPRFPNHEPITELLDQTARRMDVYCLRGTCWERASLQISESLSVDLLCSLSQKRIKSLRRGGRALEKRGMVRFEFQTDPSAISQCAEELIQLESLGWKSTVGTALASSVASQQFFREMITSRNRHHEVFFTRILIDEVAVASVAHLQAGDVAYAFKLGWNPEMERGCPGFQIKFQAAMRAAGELPGIRMIDSCSSPGSFIEHVWPHRRSFCNRVYVTSPAGQLAASMLNGLRWVRNSARAMSRHLFPSDDLSERNGTTVPENPREPDRPDRSGQ